MNPLFPELTRRDFMSLAAAGAVTVAAGAIGIAQEALSTAPIGANGVEGDWFDRPMRWMQLVLVENDPGQYDPQWWLDLFKRSHIDAVCLSAGGCICYYPTKVPYHYKSAWMKEGMDPFGELLAGCRKLGIIVVARTDPHAILKTTADAHPEWAAISASGNRVPHTADPDRVMTCPYGPYNFEFMTDVHREIMNLYKVDSIFVNRWQGSAGQCFCESCKKQYRDFAGAELTPGARGGRGGGEGGSRRYTEWTNKRLFELWRLWDEEIRKIKPNARFIANAGGGSNTSLDMATISELAPTLFADRQSRRGVMTPWANGKNGKEFRAAFGRKPIVGIASLGIDDNHRWKDSVISEPELRIWIADGVANGLRPWVAKFSGTVYDKRWVPGVEKIFEWQWRNEKYLRNEENLARVAMIVSQQTGMYYGSVEQYEDGFYQALVEGRIPFEMAHDKLLDQQHLDRFKLLILPNTAALSDAQCEQLRQFVRRGGSLIASYETSLYNETGQRRSDFGLADLFGVSYAGNVETQVKNSYIRIEAETKHPILKGLEDAGRIINTVSHVNVKATTPFPNPPLTRIPSYPDLPMEAVWPRVPKTDIPEVYLREYGKGRVVYFPGDLERTFWEILAVDHGTLLRNAVEWAMNEEQPVTVKGQGMLDVVVWRQKQSMTVHMVNLTNPMLFKAPYRELIPSPPQEVTVKLPAGAKASAVKLLVAGQNVAAQQSSDGKLLIPVPSILDHEVIAIDL
jgi:hypothetical protein